MGAAFKLIIMVLALASLAYCVGGCAPVANVDSAPPYKVCDTPDCGVNIPIVVE